MVNRGKKIAIGGSITAITRAEVAYIPSTRAPDSQSGQAADHRFRRTYPLLNRVSNSWDG